MPPSATAPAQPPLTKTGSSSNYGGIAGYNDGGTLSHNLAIGAVVPAANDNCHGAICGFNSKTLQNNYYFACTVAGVENATNVGCGVAHVSNFQIDYFYTTDVTENDGAVPMPALSDTEDNTAAIATLATRGDQGLPTTYPVILQGRTLYKDGEWNTLTLPFGLTTEQIAASPLAGATIKELNGSTSNLDGEGLLTLNFDAVTSIEAGKPYLVKWDEDTENPTIVNPVFQGVTIDDSNNDVVFEGGTFKGTYSPLEISEALGNKNDILLLAAGNKLGYSKTDRTLANGKALGCFRAYFEIPADNGNNAARRFALNFGDDGTTGVIPIEDGKWEMENVDDAMFDLQGRKVKNLVKGLYIVNGKKVLVK